MAIRSAPRRPRAEPTIALINIVFLILIFFMVAGALAPPMDGRVELVRTSDLDGRAPPDAAVVLPDGSMTWRDRPVDAAGVVEQSRERNASGAPAVRLIPDRALPAAELLRLARELRSAGAGAIWIVTERALE